MKEGRSVREQPGRSDNRQGNQKAGRKKEHGKEIEGGQEDLNARKKITEKEITVKHSDAYRVIQRNTYFHNVHTHGRIWSIL